MNSIPAFSCSNARLGSIDVDKLNVESQTADVINVEVLNADVINMDELNTNKTTVSEVLTVNGSLEISKESTIFLKDRGLGFIFGDIFAPVTVINIDDIDGTSVDIELATANPNFIAETSGFCCVLPRPGVYFINFSSTFVSTLQFDKYVKFQLIDIASEVILHDCVLAIGGKSTHSTIFLNTYVMNNLILRVTNYSGQTQSFAITKFNVILVYETEY